MVLKKCFVPTCSNTNLNSSKLFMTVPGISRTIRKEWFAAVKCEESQNNNLYCCEDHFDLENDTENWTQYKTMGHYLRLKINTVPHKHILCPKVGPRSITQLTNSCKRRKKNFLSKLSVGPDGTKIQYKLKFVTVREARKINPSVDFQRAFVNDVKSSSSPSLKKHKKKSVYVLTEHNYSLPWRSESKEQENKNKAKIKFKVQRAEDNAELPVVCTKGKPVQVQRAKDNTELPAINYKGKQLRVQHAEDNVELPVIYFNGKPVRVIKRTHRIARSINLKLQTEATSTESVIIPPTISSSTTTSLLSESTTSQHTPDTSDKAKIESPTESVEDVVRSKNPQQKSTNGIEIKSRFCLGEKTVSILDCVNLDVKIFIKPANCILVGMAAITADYTTRIQHNNKKSDSWDDN